MIKILSFIRDLIWSLPTLILLLTLGIYFTKKCAFYRPKTIHKICKELINSLKKSEKNHISPFSAVATALGGTVGIGSIVGVGYAIQIGGAGSIFWMWICSFFGMGLKYAEVKIALNNRRNTKNGKFGGAPFRLKDLGYTKIAVLFAVFCIFASFGTGNLTQTGVVSEFLVGLGIPEVICGIICCFVVGISVLGNKKRIAGINAFLIPVASVVYLLVIICIIISNPTNVFDSLTKIFKEAFGLTAFGGGFSGYALSHVIQEGFARSMFSNEAGMGSSPLAHATADGIEETQAKWGIFEIFFDTFVVSTLTAFALLSYKTDNVFYMFRGFLGRYGIYIFGILTAVFAFASIISWCYYGKCCIAFLFPDNVVCDGVYGIVFSLVAFLGCCVPMKNIWDMADILNGLMMFPNLFLLYKCRNEIERI